MLSAAKHIIQILDSGHEGSFQSQNQWLRAGCRPQMTKCIGHFTHKNTHRGGARTAIEGEAANICMKRSRDVWRLSTPAALSFPAAGTYLMSCFASWRASGLAFRFSGKLKFLLGTGNDYSMAYRFILNASLASFV